MDSISRCYPGASRTLRIGAKQPKRPRHRAIEHVGRFEELETRRLPSIFVVNVANDSTTARPEHCPGSCTLRSAVELSNSTPGLDSIHFSIPEQGIPNGSVPSIQLLSRLPDITEAVIIDGTTQQAGHIVIDGSKVVPSGADPKNFPSLVIRAGGSTLRGITSSIRLVDAGQNVLEGNRLQLRIDAGSDHNILRGNDYIDAIVEGSLTVIEGNRINTLYLSANNTIIGGTDASARNMVEIMVLEGSENQILGNEFNWGSDIRVLGDSNVFGGISPGAGNSIVNAAIHIRGRNTLIQGNTLVNTRIEITNSSDNLIGGTDAAARNVMSGYQESLIEISGSLATNNRIQGNLIGIDANGIQTGCTIGPAIAIDSASGNLIGGLEPNAGNTFAYCGSGVRISETTGPAEGNAIVGNSIYSTSALPIELVGEYRNDDPGDGDSGPNGGQNTPILIAATGWDVTSVRGVVNNTPFTQQRVDFYTNPAFDKYGPIGWQHYGGSITVTTDSFGHSDFEVEMTFDLHEISFLTATVTDPSGNTSQFSNMISIAPKQPLSTGISQDVLVVAGTERADVISVVASPSTDELRVTVNSTSFSFVLHAISSLYIDGGLRNDRVTVDDSVSFPAMILGGSGNDVLNGGAGDEFIYGGDGNDQLSGGRGQDIVDGGAGNDILTASRGHDILWPGPGSNSIRLGTLNASLQKAVIRTASSDPIPVATRRKRSSPILQVSRQIQVTLDRTLSGSIEYAAPGRLEMPWPSCAGDFNMTGNNEHIRDSSYYVKISSVIVHPCAAQLGPNRTAFVEASLIGVISLQNGTITSRGDVRLIADPYRSETPWKQTDPIVEVLMDIS